MSHPACPLSDDGGIVRVSRQNVGITGWTPNKERHRRIETAGGRRNYRTTRDRSVAGAPVPQRLAVPTERYPWTIEAAIGRPPWVSGVGLCRLLLIEGADERSNWFKRIRFEPIGTKANKAAAVDHRKDDGQGRNRTAASPSRAAIDQTNRLGPRNAVGSRIAARRCHALC